MPDVFTPTKRSEVMSGIRGRGNRSTELRLVQLLREAGITGWRRQVEVKELKASKVGKGRFVARRLRVRPDFVFAKERVAVFVDGCFWHGCPRCFQKPKQNAAFWRDKIGGNQARDRWVTRRLRSLGWHVCRIWECRLKRPEAVIRRVVRMLERSRSVYSGASSKTQ